MTPASGLVLSKCVSEHIVYGHHAHFPKHRGDVYDATRMFCLLQGQLPQFFLGYFMHPVEVLDHHNGSVGQVRSERALQLISTRIVRHAQNTDRLTVFDQEQACARMGLCVHFHLALVIIPHETRAVEENPVVSFAQEVILFGHV